MRFVKYTFIGAGIWGLVVLLPFYALVDITGRRYAPPTEYPQFFWRFLSVALAWQIAFLIIRTDPVRFRPLMIPATLEKMGYVATRIVLYAGGRISSLDFQPVLPDFALGVLFVVAYAMTGKRTS